jgi:hypothetical protein
MSASALQNKQFNPAIQLLKNVTVGTTTLTTENNPSPLHSDNNENFKFSYYQGFGSQKSTSIYINAKSKGVYNVKCSILASTTDGQSIILSLYREPSGSNSYTSLDGFEMTRVYKTAGGPSLLTVEGIVELNSGDHLKPYLGNNDSNDPIVVSYINFTAVGNIIL